MLTEPQSESSTGSRETDSGMHQYSIEAWLFWTRPNCNIKQKNIVDNAVIRSKKLYGLDSLELTQATRQRLDSFQLQGFREILRQLTTYGQMMVGKSRTNTNKQIMQKIKKWYLFNAPEHQPILPLSENYKQ